MLDLTPSETALIIVDLQEGILSPEPTPFGRAVIVGKAAELSRAFADAGAPIVLTVTDFAAGYSDLPRGKADAPWALPADGLPEGFSTLVPEIGGLSAAVRIVKRQLSAFFGTELDLQLRRRGIRSIVICGVATNLGVEATARDAYALDYDVVIASDACGSMKPGWHAFSIENMLPFVARIRSADEIVDAIRTPAAGS